MIETPQLLTTTTVVKLWHINQGRFGILSKARKLAATALKVKSPLVKQMQVCTRRLADGLNHDVLEITWGVS